MRWHIEDILFNAFPALHTCLKDCIKLPKNILLIPVHQTEQWPLPAMHIDESSLEGTLKVLEAIRIKTLKMSADLLEKHGIILCAGDQLTMSLLDKVLSLFIISHRIVHLIDSILRYRHPDAMIHCLLIMLASTLKASLDCFMSRLLQTIWLLLMLPWLRKG